MQNTLETCCDYLKAVAGCVEAVAGCLTAHNSAQTPQNSCALCRSPTASARGSSTPEMYIYQADLGSSRTNQARLCEELKCVQSIAV